MTAETYIAKRKQPIARKHRMGKSICRFLYLASVGEKIDICNKIGDLKKV